MYLPCLGIALGLFDHFHFAQILILKLCAITFFMSCYDGFLVLLLGILIYIKSQTFAAPSVIVEICVKVWTWSQRIFFVFLFNHNSFDFLDNFPLVLIFWVILIIIIFAHRLLVVQGYLMLLLIIIDAHRATWLWISNVWSKLRLIRSYHWATLGSYQWLAWDGLPFFEVLVFNYKLRDIIGFWTPFIIEFVWTMTQLHVTMIQHWWNRG